MGVLRGHLQDMGQEVRMRKRRYLIPLVVFTVCTAIAFSIVISRRLAVRQMFNDAGRDGKPVVFFQSFDAYQFENYVVSLDHKPVELFSRSLGPFMMCPYFTENGSLHFLKSKSNARLFEHWTLAFPDIQAKLTDSWESDFFHENDSMFFTYTNQQYVVWADLDDFQIIDFATGENTKHAFERQRPWPFRNYRLGHSEYYKISPDLTVIVARERYSTDIWNIWRYDIPVGVWSLVVEKQSGYILNVGPEGKVIGLGNDRIGPSETIFVDGFTGNTIHTIQYSVKSAICEKWIVYNPFPGFRDLVFIDMEDDWKEYRITLPTRSVERIVVYVPPQGGVEEMLRMREEAGD